MKLPDLNKDVVVRTDASRSAIGATILQEHELTLFPVAYGSHKVTKAERNYSISKKEYLSIVFALTRFQPYLNGLP